VEKVIRGLLDSGYDHFDYANAGALDVENADFERNSLNVDFLTCLANRILPGVRTPLYPSMLAEYTEALRDFSDGKTVDLVCVVQHFLGLEFEGITL
jgi:hypothetical protein